MLLQPSLNEKLESYHLPTHVGIILDGNGRWALQRNLSIEEGHKEGAKALERIAKHSTLLGIQYLTVFCFSTENWGRPESEINNLFSLFQRILAHRGQLSLFQKEQIKLNVIGDIKQFPYHLQRLIEQTINLTRNNSRLTLTLALNYGGQADIVQAVQQIGKDIEDGKIAASQVNKPLFEQYLMTKTLPPVDLLIRPGGEVRISNFLLYQMAYAELYFCNTLWPDYNEKNFEDALSYFNTKQRRYGAR